MKEFSFKIFLYEVGNKKLPRPRNIVGEGSAYSTERLEQNIEKDLQKQYGGSAVKFLLCSYDLTKKTF